MTDLSLDCPQRRSKIPASVLDLPLEKWLGARKWFEIDADDDLVFAAFVDRAKHIAVDIIPKNGRYRPQKRQTCLQILYQLFCGEIGDYFIYDGRNTSAKGVHQRTAVWDLLIEQGWATAYCGNRRAELCTRYEPGDKIRECLPWALEVLNEAAAGWDTLPSAHERLPGIIGHSGKRDLATGEKMKTEHQKIPLIVPQEDHFDFEQLVRNSELLQQINGVNNRHKWQATIKSGNQIRPMVSLHQKHIGRWFRAARLYTNGPFSAQSLSKTIRSTMTIDGQPTVELDFSSMFPRMLYHTQGIPKTGDAYNIDKIFPSFGCVSGEVQSAMRELVKRATNIAFNNGSRSEASRAISSHCRDHLDRDELRRYFHEVQNPSPKLLLDRIEAAHPEIQSQFYQDVGMELMTREANIMLAALSEITGSGIPAVGIHDGIRCRACDSDFVKRVMERCYQEVCCGFSPEIRLCDKKGDRSGQMP